MIFGQPQPIPSISAWSHILIHMVIQGSRGQHFLSLYMEWQLQIYWELCSSSWSMCWCNDSSWVASLLNYTIMFGADVHHLTDPECLSLFISPFSLGCEAVSFSWLSNTKGLITHLVLYIHSCKHRQRPWEVPEVSIWSDSGMTCLSWVIKMIINLYHKCRKLFLNLIYGKTSCYIKLNI